jgi:cbb3-type cytochrome oxidase maturation protein
MYYPYFIVYMASGFVISIVVFFWALNNGQFKDQQRARFIPLENDSSREPVRLKTSRFARIEIMALFSLVCICLMCSVAVVVFALMKAAK